MEKTIVIISIIVVVALVVVYNQIISPVSAKEQGCINSGGIVSTSLCCKSVSDFPDTCLIGACGCSPTNSHDVKVCDCPEDKCFDGNKCV